MSYPIISCDYDGNPWPIDLNGAEYVPYAKNIQRLMDTCDILKQNSTVHIKDISAGQLAQFLALYNIKIPKIPYNDDPVSTINRWLNGLIVCWYLRVHEEQARFFISQMVRVAHKFGFIQQFMDAMKLNDAPFYVLLGFLRRTELDSTMGETPYYPQSIYCEILHQCQLAKIPVRNTLKVC